MERRLRCWLGAGEVRDTWLRQDAEAFGGLERKSGTIHHHVAARVARVVNIVQRDNRCFCGYYAFPSQVRLQGSEEA